MFRVRNKDHYYNACIHMAYSISRYWQECHGNKTIHNVLNLVARIQSDQHYRLIIISAIDTDPGLVNMVSRLHKNIK